MCCVLVVVLYVCYSAKCGVCVLFPVSVLFVVGCCLCLLYRGGCVLVVCLLYEVCVVCLFLCGFVRLLLLMVVD